ncbi:MAG: hypothetical protein ACYDDF_10610 [Thermoplasmatota archaeon]
MAHTGRAIWIGIGLLASSLTALSGLGHAAILCSPQAVQDQLGCEGWYATFEVEVTNPTQHDPSAYNDANGPKGQETQAIPPDPVIPSRFVGLPDILVKPAAQDAPAWVQSHLPTNTYAVLDAQEYGSLTVVGDDEPATPYGYLGAEALHQTWTEPSNMFLAFYGYWHPIVGDNVIHDEECGQPYFCSPTDEFVYRGDNTGEAVQGLAWNFPGGYSVYFGQGAFVGTGLAGNCKLYAQYDQGCISPSPAFNWWDTTNASQNGNYQAWQAGGGWSGYTPEDSLVVSRYIVSVFGPTNLAELSNYTYQIDAPASTPGFFRDMDWYQALAPASVQELYLSTMHRVRDTEQETQIPNVLTTPPIVNQTEQQAFDTEAYTCPTSPAGVCARDVRQIVAKENQPKAVPPGAESAPYITATFNTVAPYPFYTPDSTWDQYWCAQTGMSPCLLNSIPYEGLQGVASVGNPYLGNGQTTFAASAPMIYAETTAWAWYDADGDGYIGHPDNYTVQQYNAGMFATANTGTGDNDIVRGLANQFNGVAASPSSAGWPPGSFLVRNFEFPLHGAPLGDPGQGNYLTPLSGTSPAKLRSGACAEGATTCGTIDALIIPSGTAEGLQGDTGPVTISWVDLNAQAESYTQDYTWSQSI